MCPQLTWPLPGLCHQGRPQWGLPFRCHKVPHSHNAFHCHNAPLYSAYEGLLLLLLLLLKLQLHEGIWGPAHQVLPVPPPEQVLLLVLLRSASLLLEDNLPRRILCQYGVSREWLASAA